MQKLQKPFCCCGVQLPPPVAGVPSQIHSVDSLETMKHERRLCYKCLLVSHIDQVELGGIVNPGPELELAGLHSCLPVGGEVTHGPIIIIKHV